MNVIIANKYQDMLSTLDIDVIKSMNGVFEVDDIVATFSNFFFNRMILDITAINNYTEISNIQKLSVNLDMSKVILLLDDSPLCSSPSFLSKLVSMGIYNFSRNIDNIKYLLENPNTYKDVANLQNFDDNNETSTQTSTGGITQAQAPIPTKIIGIKNVTQHAGATTLIYMMKRQLQKAYSVKAFELEKYDFSLFNDSDLKSVSKSQLPAELIKAKDTEVILLDLNNSTEEENCSIVIYLVEPSTIRLNRAIRKNKNTFTELKGKNIVLNQSMLNNKDIDDFEYESKSKIFYNIPPINDKDESYPVLNEFLVKLGFVRLASDNKENKKFRLFK